MVLGIGGCYRCRMVLGMDGVRYRRVLQVYDGVSTNASPSVGCPTTRKVNILTGR